MCKLVRIFVQLIKFQTDISQVSKKVSKRVIHILPEQAPPSHKLVEVTPPYSSALPNTYTIPWLFIWFFNKSLCWWSWGSSRWKLCNVWHLTAYEAITVTSWNALGPDFTNCFDSLSDFTDVACQCGYINRESSK